MSASRTLLLLLWLCQVVHLSEAALLHLSQVVEDARHLQDAVSDMPSDAPSDSPSDVPSDIPTTVPSEAPVSSSLPTFEQTFPPLVDCSTALDSLLACVDTNYTAEMFDACDTCLTARLEDLLFSGSCDGIEETCTAIIECPCEGCDDPLIDYYSCAIEENLQCSIDCNAVPSVSPAPSLSPAPTPASSVVNSIDSSVCPELLDLLAECFFAEFLDNADALACDKCLGEVLDIGAAPGCNVRETAVCQGIDVCSCSTCNAIITDYFECYFAQQEGCSFDCGTDAPAIVPTPAPTILNTVDPNVCVDTLNPVLDCFAIDLSPSEVQACDVCLANEIVLTVPADCGTRETDVCAGILTCPCGVCTDLIEAHLECYLAETESCAFNCSTIEPAPTMSPVAVPDIPPTVGEACATEQLALEECGLGAGIDGADVCQQCLSTALSDPSILIDCPTLGPATCNAIVDCPCAACDSELVDFLACSFRAALLCEIDCDGIVP